jgi:hypothetical protein
MPEETNIPYLSFNVCHGLVCYAVGTVCLTFSVSISVPSVAETDRGIEPFLSGGFPAYIRWRRVVRVPMLTRPTMHLTRKLRSYLRKRVGGMSLQVTRMGTSCCFKYVPANTVASCPRLHPLPAPVSGSHVTHTPIRAPLCFIHQLRLTPCRPWYCTSTPLF